MMTGSQCQAARVLLDLTRDTLAQAADIPVDVIEKFEHRLDHPTEDTIVRLQEALEDEGVLFLQEGEAGIGVRLKRTGADEQQLARLEDEGGMTT